MNALSNIHPVAVIGAGPAGLYAARQLAAAGMPVALINRDIRPGGLAEYGIYYIKYKMKLGLRKQFHQIMETPNLHYFGNVTVGQDRYLTLEKVRKLGFKAILVTAGAQGTKRLGMSGEDLKGVFHAKDLVYHYNQLPPYSQQEFAIGDRVILIGAGNVMIDIAHYCIRDRKVKHVTAVVRRGPADVKFTKKELEYVAANLDLEALDAEIARTASVLESVNQNPEEAKAFILSALDKAPEPVSDTKFDFLFLASPKAIQGDEHGRVAGLEIEETTLELNADNSTSSYGLGKTRVLDANTVIFCIGDTVSPTLGLPLDRWREYAKNPSPHFPIDHISYEAFDPDLHQPLEGIFLGGWSREASSGLVGTARKDGENGAKALLQYLDTLPATADPEQAILALEDYLRGQPEPVVRKPDYMKLAEEEEQNAARLGIEMYKFTSNEEMLQAMGFTQVVGGN